jgi:hypothetical protein
VVRTVAFLMRANGETALAPISAATYLFVYTSLRPSKCVYVRKRSCRNRNRIVGVTSESIRNNFLLEAVSAAINQSGDF